MVAASLTRPDAEPAAPERPAAIWRLPSPLLFVLVAGAYALCAQAAAATVAITGVVAVLFLPSGVAAAALLRTPRRQWWVVLGAVTVAGVAVDALAGTAPALLAAYAVANAVEPLAGAAVTLTLVRRPLDLVRRGHVLAFLAGSVLAGPALGAGVGVLGFALAGSAPAPGVWLHWWLGDAAGVALVGVALLAWGSSPDRRAVTATVAAAFASGAAAATLAAIVIDPIISLVVLLVVAAAGAMWGVRAVAVATGAVAATLALTVLAVPQWVPVEAAGPAGLLLLDTRLMVFAIVGLWVAAESSDRERAAREAERASAEAARLAESEAQLRAVFSSIDEGFCVCEMICVDGVPVDYRFLDVNPIFEEMTGIQGAAGRRIRELVPDIEEHWVEIYTRVAMHGEVLRFEQESPALGGRWYDVFAMPLALPGRFALVFKDQTERRRADLALRATARAEAFRARLLQALQDADDVVGVQAAAARLLGEHLGLSRAHYMEVDADGRCGTVRAGFDAGFDAGPDAGSGDSHGPGRPDLVGRHDLDAWSAALVRDLRAGVTVAVTDVTTDERLTPDERAAAAALGARACLVVPMVRDRAWVATLSAHHRDAHHWSDDERKLVAEAADLTWAAVEQARAEEAVALRRDRAELVADMLADLETLPDTQAQLECVVDTLVPRFADFASVEAPDAEPHILALAHRSSGGRTVLRALRLRHRDQPHDGMSIRGAVHGESELISVITPEIRSRLVADPTTAGLVERLDPRSHMAVPLDLGHRAPKAALVVGLSGTERRPYAAEDLAFLQETARRAGLVIAARRLHEEEHDIAARLQQALLPDQIRWHPNVMVEARYAAAADLMDVGGDWYDSFTWPDGRLGVMVGDVVGHNLESAAAMGRMRAATAALAANLAASPAAVLDALESCAQGPDGSDYVTAACVVIDPDSGRLVYSGAGHPPGLVVSPSGTVTRLDGAQSLPLSGHTTSRRPEAVVELAAGSMVVLYSDGLIERRGRRLEDGINRLAELAAQSRYLSLPDAADAILDGMTDGAVLDDVVVACLRFAPAVDTLTLRVPALGGQLANVRRRVRLWMHEHEIAERDQGSVLVAIGEACTNAAEHAYRRGGEAPGAATQIDIELSLHGSYMAVRVTDAGTWRLPAPREGAGGRGTSIMRTLAHRFDRLTGPAGTEVRMAIPLSQSDEADEADHD